MQEILKFGKENPEFLCNATMFVCLVLQRKKQRKKERKKNIDYGPVSYTSPIKRFNVYS